MRTTPTSYEDLRDMLLERAEQRPVFFKDMSYYVMPRIIEDHDFCRRLTNCFLIRNPVASIPSYHQLDPEVTSLEIGLEAQWNHFEALQSVLDTVGYCTGRRYSRRSPGRHRHIVGKNWS